MTGNTDNSSLPLLLSITGAVVLVAGGGWFYLEQAEAPRTDVQQSAPPDMDTGIAATDDPASDTAAESLAESDAEETADTAPDVDAELSKARLAAGADILIFPPEQSALHYYGRVLAAQPNHAIAIAELDAVLATVAQTVTAQLARGAYGDAYEIAVQVARHRPEHALVIQVQQTLDALTEEQVQRAIQEAQAGNDEAANELLASVAALPGRNPEYLAAVRDSLDEIRNVRLEAERDRLARAQLADEEAKTAWLDRINTAISFGNLLTPAGASARDLLAEQNNWDAERTEMTASLVAALGSTAESRIASQRLDEAEALLTGAVELTGDTGQFATIRDSLEQAYIDAESSRVKVLTELVRVKTMPARYPRTAERRNITGWVDVLFTVTPSGETSDIEVRGAEPESIFDQAAIDAVAQWEFQPVEYRGQVISQRAGARLSFKLE